MSFNWNQKSTVAIAIMLVGILSIAVVTYLRQPRLVVIDMTRAIQEPARRLSHSKLTEARQVKIMQRYAILLPDVIKSYGQNHQLTIISATVLAGKNNRLDITHDIIEQTIIRLKHDA